VRGKLQMAAAMLRGNVAALRMMPRMLRKRRELGRIRKMSPRDVRRMILAHRLPLKETV
jgi:hypothetical protein